MQKYVKAFRWCAMAALFATTVMLNTGCATNGRHVLLKEYGPSVPPLPGQPLKGKTVCIKGFQCAPNLTSQAPKGEPEQPPQFAFVPFTGEQNKTWDKEFRELKKQTTKTDWREIGNLRNGLGMVMSHVYALNDPGPWLGETLKMDLESQGATVVDAAQAATADLCVGGTIQFCRVDIYMKIWGDLVVDLELTPKSGNPVRRTVHTEGGTVAWVAATSEFYKPLRECRQKFSWLATQEIIKHAR